MLQLIQSGLNFLFQIKENFSNSRLITDENERADNTEIYGA